MKNDTAYLAAKQELAPAFNVIVATCIGNHICGIKSRAAMCSFARIVSHFKINKKMVPPRRSEHAQLLPRNCR
jgi:hypothetical protein